MRILLLLLAFVSWAAQAQLKPEISLGMTNFKHQDNGIWWQDGPEFPHELKMTSPTVAIGLKGGIPLLSWGAERTYWRGGYQYLGRVTSTALATSDENYAACYLGAAPCWKNKTHFKGVGNVQGFYLSLVPEYPIGECAIFAELGAYAFMPRWKVTLPDARPIGDDPYSISYTVRHRDQWLVTPVLGIGVRYKGTSIAFAYRHVWGSGDEFSPLYKGSKSVEFRQAF